MYYFVQQASAHAAGILCPTSFCSSVVRCHDFLASQLDANNRSIDAQRYIGGPTGLLHGDLGEHESDDLYMAKHYTQRMHIGGPTGSYTATYGTGTIKKSHCQTRHTRIDSAFWPQVACSSQRTPPRRLSRGWVANAATKEDPVAAAIARGTGVGSVAAASGSAAANDATGLKLM